MYFNTTAKIYKYNLPFTYVTDSLNHLCSKQERRIKRAWKCQVSCWSRDVLPKWLWSHFFDRTLVLHNTCREQYSNMEENISCMEEECLIEKRRATILKECKEILQEEGSGRYSKDAFRRLFQGQVRVFCLIRIKIS